MSEVRTTSATGGEKGMKAQRYDLLPKLALDQIAEVYAFGAEKYADHNWRRGYEWSKSYAALQRHLQAFWEGETFDAESGLNHLGHAGFHIFALLTWFAEQGEGVDNVYDDRWPHGLERARLAAEEERMLEELEGREEAEVLPDGWANLGFLSEDLTFNPAPPAPPAADIVYMVARRISAEGGPPPPESLGIKVKWADPARRTLEDIHTKDALRSFDSFPSISFTMRDVPDESLALAMGVSVEEIYADRRRSVRARFIAGPDGTTDHDAPFTDYGSAMLAIQDRINADIARLARETRINPIFINPEPLRYSSQWVRDYDGAIDTLSKRRPIK